MNRINVSVKGIVKAVPESLAKILLRKGLAIEIDIDTAPKKAKAPKKK